MRQYNQIINSTAIIASGLLVILSCRSDPPEDLAETHRQQLMAYQLGTISSLEESATDTVISDVKLCRLAIDLYNETEPNQAVSNPFKDLSSSTIRWSFRGSDPSRYFTLTAEQIREFSLTMKTGDSEDAETVYLSCPLPVSWLLRIWQDAVVVYPEALTAYAESEPFNEQILAHGSLGGFGFQHLLGIGYDVSFSWYLQQDPNSEQLVLNELKMKYPFVNLQALTVEKQSLIPMHAPDPLQIIALTNDSPRPDIKQLLVKGNLYPSSASLMPFKSFWQEQVDFSLNDPLEAMAVNSHSSLISMTRLSYPDLIPIPCRTETSITDPQNCSLQNQNFIHSYFTPWFKQKLAGQPPSSEVCVLAYFSTTISVSKGLAKYLCLDSSGTVELRYNGIHDYIDEAIEHIGQEVIR